jgi:hypothetical protein
MAATKDFDTLKDLILWARSEGIILGDVKVGEITVSMQDQKALESVFGTIGGKTEESPGDDTKDRRPRPRTLHDALAEDYGVEPNPEYDEWERESG